MMPMKKASSDMNSAARPRKLRTRLSALATGLRLMTTAAPKPSINAAKIQKRIDDMRALLLLVPLQNDAFHDAADLEELLLVVHHLRTREAGDRVILPQKNRLLRTNLLAHAAVDAAD